MAEVAMPSPDRPKPSMHLSSDDVPFDGLTLDQDVEMTVKGRIKSMSSATTGEFASPGSITVEVNNVDMGKDPEKKAKKTEFAV